MVRARGARTLAIVNRRDSDITFKVDGVLYTSSGRDIEMSVASTKAFYSQIVAGALLGLKIAQHQRPTGFPNFITEEIKAAGRSPTTCAPSWPWARSNVGPAAGRHQNLLGRRRQRSQQGLGRRNPHQAQRTVLQDHLLGLRGGQEAHRPVLRAADHRLRGRIHPKPSSATSSRTRPSSKPTRPLPWSSPTREERFRALCRRRLSRSGRSANTWPPSSTPWWATSGAITPPWPSTTDRVSCTRSGNGSAAPLTDLAEQGWTSTN
jgi:hypothetical protein